MVPNFFTVAILTITTVAFATMSSATPIQHQLNVRDSDIMMPQWSQQVYPPSLDLNVQHPDLKSTFTDRQALQVQNEEYLRTVTGSTSAPTRLAAVLNKP